MNDCVACKVVFVNILLYCLVCINHAIYVNYCVILWYINYIHYLCKLLCYTISVYKLYTLHYKYVVILSCILYFHLR